MLNDLADPLAKFDQAAFTNVARMMATPRSNDAEAAGNKPHKLALSVVELFQEFLEQQVNEEKTETESEDEADAEARAVHGWPSCVEISHDVDLSTHNPPDFAPIIEASQSRARARLLAMADRYLRAGSLRQAIEMYFDLRDEYPGTLEAELAEERSLDVADRHEREGELRLARAIYERIA